MEILRIPTNYHHQIRWESVEDVHYIFCTLLALGNGEEVEIENSRRGGVVSSIWRECVQMERRARNKKAGDTDENYVAPKVQPRVLPKVQPKVAPEVAKNSTQTKESQGKENQEKKREEEKTENQVEDFFPPIFSEIENGRILEKLPEKKVEEKKGNVPPKMAVLLPQDEMLLDMFVSEYSEAKKIPPAKIPFIQSAFLKLSDAEKKELADFLGENFFQKYLQEKGEFAKNAESFLEMKFWRELTPKKQKKVATQTIEKMMEDYQNGIL